MIRHMKDGSQQWRWTQQVFVERGDAIACYEIDLGSEEQFEMVTPLHIISPWGEDSVAECLDAADRNRIDTHWRKRAKEMQESSTLMRDIVEQREKISQVVKNRTVSGPFQTNQRNGWDHTALERQLMTQKRERLGKTQK